MTFHHTETNMPIEAQYPKLIRDKIPQIIKESKNRMPDIRVAQDDEEYMRFVLKKVVEEAVELSEARNAEHILEEAADLYEVIDALLALKGLSRAEVLAVQDEKRVKRGAFEKRLLMLSNE